MQLQYEALAQHLQRELAPFYVLTGDEYLLVQEAIDQIRQVARSKGLTERNTFIVERGFQWDSLQLAHQALSLFGERKLIEVRIPSGRPGKEGVQAIQQYISTSSDHVTLFIFPQLDWATKKLAWVGALQKHAVYIEVPIIDISRLGGWIATRLRKQHQQINALGIAFLVEQVEGNLLAAWQEIQKLGLLYPEGQLTEEQVRNAVLDVARYDVFQISEAMLEGNGSRFIRMMDGLKGEGRPLPLVLGVFANEMRMLLRCRQSLDAGMSSLEVARNNRLRGKREHLVMNALQHLSWNTLADALQRISDIDRLIKGLDSEQGLNDAWEALTLLGCSFSQHKTLSRV